MSRASPASGLRSGSRLARLPALALCALIGMLPVAAAGQVGASRLPGTNVIAQAGEPADSRTPLARLLEEARRLVDSDRADAAFRMLDARVADYAGDTEFDYLLGLAALDSGRPGQAVMALERVLMNRPDFLPARAEIARAYFVIRERENARREFETVAAQRIPDEARRVIGQYLDAIRRIDDAARPRLTGVVELETGYDSNVNFGSTSGQWVLADGTAVIPLGISTPQESAVFHTALGLNWIAPIGGGWQWTTGGRASLRRHPSAHTLDQDQFDLSSGFTLRNRCHQFNMLAQIQHLQLGDAAFRNAVGALGQWQCDLDSRTQVGAWAQAFGLDFPDEPARDARRTAFGLTFARLLGGDGRPIVLGSLHAGNESSRRDLDNLSHTFRGVRVALSRSIGGGWRGFGTVSYETRDFDGIEPFFGTVRHDRQSEWQFGAERPLPGNWSVAPVVTLTRNRSTLAPNDFRREQATVVFRYRFQ